MHTNIYTHTHTHTYIDMCVYAYTDPYGKDEFGLNWQ